MGGHRGDQSGAGTLWPPAEGRGLGERRWEGPLILQRFVGPEPSPSVTGGQEYLETLDLSPYCSKHGLRTEEGSCQLQAAWPSPQLVQKCSSLQEHTWGLP